MSTVPTLTVEIAFASDPFATPVWTDVTVYVEAVTVKRGKAGVLDNVPAGVCTVTLDNSDGRFDPNYTSGAYYPNVKPFRRIRVRAATADTVTFDDPDYVFDDPRVTFDGGPFGLFSGFITSWPQAYEWPEVSTVTVEAVDGFQILNLRKLTATYSQQLSSERVAAVLDDVSWPTADRDIETGQTTVQAATLEDDNPNGHLQAVARSENGLLFVDRDGRVAFRSRHGLIEAPFDDGRLTFGDEPGEVAFADVTVNYDDIDIWNDVRVSSQGVATQTASDADSQTAYLTRTLERSALLLTSTSEQKQHATYLLTGFAEPALRVDTLVHDQVMDSADWGSVLSRELGDKVTVSLSPPGGGDIVQRSFVEGITWTVAGDRWRCTWSLTPATRRMDFWVLGDPVQSLLGTSTRLGY